MSSRIVAIVTKNSIIIDVSINSHEDLLEKYHINDMYLQPNIVRVELCGEKLQVTQDLLPEWYHPVLLKTVKKELMFFLKKENKKK